MSRRISALLPASVALLAGALVFMLFGRVAAAQNSHPKVDFFAEGGISTTNHFTAEQLGIISFQPPQFEFSRTQSSLRTTGRLFAGVRLWLDKSQALEASYSYSPSSLVSSLTCVPACVQDSIRPIPLRANFFAGNYVHTLPSFRSLHPFLTAGAGAVFLEPRYSGIKHDPFVADLGGGVDHNLTQHWLVRAEYRDWLFDMPHYGTSGAGLVHNMVPSIGPVFRF